jgi:hypothetical protein
LCGSGGAQFRTPAFLYLPRDTRQCGPANPTHCLPTRQCRRWLDC